MVGFSEIQTLQSKANLFEKSTKRPTLGINNFCSDVFCDMKFYHSIYKDLINIRFKWLSTKIHKKNIYHS